MRLKKMNVLGAHSAYLTENMIMLLVMLVIASVVLSSFIKTQDLKKESQEQLMANVTAQNLVEYGKATNLYYNDILVDLGAEQIGDKYYFYYDDGWNQMSQMWQCAYIEEVQVKEEQLASGVLKTIQVNVYSIQLEEKNRIYSLAAKVYCV